MNINPINNFRHQNTYPARQALPQEKQTRPEQSPEQKMKSTKSSTPAFTSLFEIDGNSAGSRQQVFTLGMLMSNFWIQDSRNTFMDIKRKGVYGNFNIKVHDSRDQIVERILNGNSIYYKKITTNRPGESYY